MRSLLQFKNRSGTNTYKWDGEGKDVLFPCGCADTDFCMPECVKMALEEKINEGILSYACDKTYMKKAFCNYQKRHFHLDIPMEYVVLGTGLMSMYSVILDATSNQGDAIVVQTPTFSHLFTLPEKKGRVLIENRLVFNDLTKEWDVDFDHLRQCFSANHVKALVICNPANPISKVYSKDELTRMIQLCKEFNVVLIADEIHSDITYDDYEFTSLLHLRNLYDNLVVISGNGKVYSIAGLKVAIGVFGNTALLNAYDKEADAARMDVVDLSMIALSSAYDHGDEYVLEFKQLMQENKDLVITFLKNHDLKIEVSKPQGTYLLWFDFRKWNLTQSQLIDLLHQFGIVFSDGIEYGYQCEGYLRVNIATSKSQIEGMLHALENAYKHIF